jgi:hypothetical protein
MILSHIGDADIALERLGGTGPVIVFKAGRGTDTRSWDDVARPLAAFARIVLYGC